MDQVLPVWRNEGAVVWRQTHCLGLLVTHSVSHVEAHHVTWVGLVQGHQVELEGEGGDHYKNWKCWTVRAEPQSCTTVVTLMMSGSADNKDFDETGHSGEDGRDTTNQHQSTSLVERALIGTEILHKVINYRSHGSLSQGSGGGANGV